MSDTTAEGLTEAERRDLAQSRAIFDIAVEHVRQFRDAAEAERDAARAEVEALRERVEALVDESLSRPQPGYVSALALRAALEGDYSA